MTEALWFGTKTLFKIQLIYLTPTCGELCKEMYRPVCTFVCYVASVVLLLSIVKMSFVSWGTYDDNVAVAKEVDVASYYNIGSLSFLRNIVLWNFCCYFDIRAFSLALKSYWENSLHALLCSVLYSLSESLSLVNYFWLGLAWIHEVSSNIM